MGREAREDMCETAIKVAAGRAPVIIHVASMHFEEAIQLAKHAERAGADAIAAVPPSFFYYREEDLYNYYKRLAAAVSIPVIIYYHPAAQKDMSAALIARIFEIDNVTGVKWSSGNLYEMMRLKDITHGDMNIINGPDELLLPSLAAGADAGIGSTYNVMLPQFIEIYNSFRQGDMARAQELQMQVNRVIGTMLRWGVVPAVKQTAAMMGIDVGKGPFPMCAFNGDEAETYAKDLAAAGWPVR